ncbi:MAG: tetratricopeptide repeat protein [Sphingomonadaceae bacterium]|nr:tetratricopeptide repeat protein [Sphingomonadaceae bacterium]
MRKLLLALLIFATAPAVAAPDNAKRFERAVAAYEVGRFKVARAQFQALADQGSAVAETMLGTMYAEGRGVKADPATAAVYFYRAANRGYAPAQLALADAYAKGRGTWPDLPGAYMWARLAQVRGFGATAAAGSATAAELAKRIDEEQRLRADRWVRNWRPWTTAVR